MSTETHHEPGRKRPTLKDVAAHAGVSFKTVSRVVNGEAGVSTQLRDTVEASVKQLGFQPNVLAAGLRHGKTKSIALVVSDLTDPLQGRMAGAVEAAAAARNHLLLIAATGRDGSREDDILRTLASRPVDGVILLPVKNRASPTREDLLGSVPLVLLQQPPGKSAADVVLSDDHFAAVTAVEMLARKGHRRIAFMDCCSADDHAASARLQGYRSAMSARSLDEVAFVHLGDYGCRDFAAQLRSRPDGPTAVVIGSASSTRTFLLAARGDHGLAVATLESADAFGVLAPPAVDISSDTTRMGALAVEILLRRSPNPQGLGTVTTVLPIISASTQ